MTTRTPKPKRMGPYLRSQGFDLSEYDRSDQRWRVRCSQCQALCINGIPTHEIGCPNQRRD